MENEIDAIPDVLVLLDVEARVNHLYYGKTLGMIPALREQLHELVMRVENGNDTMRENVTGSLVALNLYLQGPSSELEEEDLLRLRQSLDTDMTQVVTALQKVDRYKSPDLTQLRQTQDQHVDQQRAAVKQQEETVQAQQQRLTEIDEVFEQLAQPSVLGALRNLIPAPEDIEKVFSGFKDPTVSVELIKAALVRLNKHLELFEQGRRYAEVVAARGLLAVRLKEQKQLLVHLKRQMKAAEASIAQFDSVEELLAQRAPWLEQTKKFVSRWQVLAESIRAATQTSVLQAALEAARDYLLVLRRRFEAA